MDTVLSVASRAVLEACERLGIDGDVLLRDAGLRREEVMEPDRRIDARKADALWRAASLRTDDEHLALHAAEALPFGAYKVVDFLAAKSASIGEAFARVVAYFPLVDPRARFEVVHEGKTTSLAMRARDQGVELRREAQEYTFAALVTRMRSCAGGGWTPEAIELSFPAPADTAELARVLGAVLRFEAPEPRIVCSASSWDAPVATAEPALLEILEEHAARLLAELPQSDDLVSRVRHAISSELSTADPALAHIAKRLGTSERTLQRDLKERGVTLNALFDEARAALAKAHLRDPSLSIADVAFLLRFADQSAFTRAFRRWTGGPPGAFRARLGVRA